MMPEGVVEKLTRQAVPVLALPEGFAAEPATIREVQEGGKPQQRQSRPQGHRGEQNRPDQARGKPGQHRRQRTRRFRPAGAANAGQQAAQSGR